SDTLTRVDHVQVHPLPEAGFRIEPETMSVLDAEAEIMDASEGAVSWIYQVEDTLYFDPDVEHLFQGSAYVPVWQTVISEHGCRDSTMRQVFITDHLFFAPNSFTPNGDGLNDAFAPVVVGARLYELIIYDRL